MSDASALPFESTDAEGASGTPVAILFFTATNEAGDTSTFALPGLPGSLQVEAGTKVKFTWALSGEADSLSLSGADVSLQAGATSYEMAVGADTEFALTVGHGGGEISETIHVFVHPQGEVVSQHATISAPAEETPAYSIQSGEDIYLDPPVRLWAQYDGRWSGRTLGRTTPMPQTCKLCGKVEVWHWHAAACSASSAAMVLRWWAEDCKATRGKYPFPSLDGSKLGKELYGPRMAQAFFPHGSPLWGETDNPAGEVLLNSKSGGGVNFKAIFNAAAKSLGLAKASYLEGESFGGNADQWIATIKDWLRYGPIVLGIGKPAAHFCVLQGYVDGELQIVDPGGVFWQMWNSNCTFKQRMPALDAWDPPIKAGDGELDYRDYLTVKKEHVAELLTHAINITSFTAPGGPVLDGKAVPSGTPPAEVPRHNPEQPADQPDSCSHCRGLQVAIDNDQCEARIKRGSHYRDVVAHYQWHLKEFGFDLGNAGVDGDFGNATANATGLFREEIGQAGDSDCCDAELARQVIAKHKADYKSTGTCAPLDDAAPESDAGARSDAGDVEIEKHLTYFQYTAYHSKAKPDTYFLKGRYEVDVDGAPNCYHSDKNRQPKPGRYRYAEMDLEGTDPLDPQGDGGHPGNWFGVVTDTGEVTGTPVVQQSGKFAGYFVSQTALVRSGKDRTDPERYADSRYIPYWSIPVRVYKGAGAGLTLFTQTPTGRYGDYATAVNLRTNAYSHAILADSGDQVDTATNTASWGEGSFALAKAIGLLGGTDKKYDVLWIVYPHSGAGQGTIPTADEILQKGEQLFSDWGGMAMVQSVLAKMK